MEIWSAGSGRSCFSIVEETFSTDSVMAVFSYDWAPVQSRRCGDRGDKGFHANRMQRAMKSLPPIPRGVWVLGFVSLLMDISSEMIHSLLPLYLTVGLGASALVVGIIEGVAESTALVVKLFSGALSDRLRKRKWITAAGYGMAALAQPLFSLATGPL